MEKWIVQGYSRCDGLGLMAGLTLWSSANVWHRKSPEGPNHIFNQTCRQYAIAEHGHDNAEK